MKMHDVGQTLIPSRPKIVRATLQNCTTLIQFQPRQEVLILIYNDGNCGVTSRRFCKILQNILQYYIKLVNF